MSDIYRPEGHPGPIAQMDPGGGGIVALAQMSEEEFNFKLGLLKKGRQRITRIHAELMEKGSDYDAIPGTGTKPTLLQPGAEKLCQFYGLAPEYISTTTYGDGIHSPEITVTTVCRMHAGNHNGAVIGESVGVCTNWEKKYRYRGGERSCPACNGVGTIIKGREEYGGGWVCFKNKGGCGAKFKIDDPAITQQVVTDVPNPDPFELLNTITKMSEKRSLVGACKFATATSHLYTQDVEDLVEYMGDASAEPTREPEPPRERSRSQAPRTPPRQPAPPAGDRSPESSGDRAATNGKCPECKASKGHAPSCKTGKAQSQAPAADATPTNAPTQEPKSSASPATETDRKAALSKLFAVYKSADGPDDDELMKRFLSQILTSVLGEPVKILSRGAMSVEWLEICSDYIFEHGLPALVDQPHADPFISE